MKHVLSVLSRRYPQLLFPIVTGISASSDYKDAVYRGKEYFGPLEYSMSEKDELVSVDTPVGSIDVLLLHNRTDFEKSVCALAYRCEPRIIPSTVGAFLISGITNWEKVRIQYAVREVDGGAGNGVNSDWLIKNKRSFLDKIIVLSSGFYSGISPEIVGILDDEWLEKSTTIRLYHEITHFVCRTLHPNSIDVFRDEVFADMIGMIAAFGRYDAELAKLFLGISEGANYSENARIRHYLKDQDAYTASQKSLFWISWLANRTQQLKEENINDVIVDVFEELLSVECP